MSRLDGETSLSQISRRRIGRRLPIFIVAILLIAQAVVSICAVSGKSPTFDEPRSLMGAYLQVHGRDFRVNPEDPPLWKYLCGLALPPASISANKNLSSWELLTHHFPDQTRWCVDTLFRTSGTDADALFFRARCLMVPLATVLGVIIAAWAWRLGGPLASIVAVAVYCFDPNFIAHAPLLKGDVPITLATLGAAMSVWSLGRRITALGVVALTAFCAVGTCSKFSAILLIPIVAALLLARAMSSKP